MVSSSRDRSNQALRSSLADLQSERAVRHAQEMAWQASLGETFQLLGPHPSARFVGSWRPFVPMSNHVIDALGNLVVDEFGHPVQSIDARLPMLQGVPPGLRLIAAPDTAPPGKTRASWCSNVLPQGQLCCVRGSTKVGKTLLGHEILARLSRGEAILDLPPGPKLNGLLVSASEGGEVVRHWPRLNAAGADAARVNVVTHSRFLIPPVVDDTDTVSFDVLSISETPHLLKTAIERLGVSVLVLNTFRALAPNSFSDSHEVYLDQLASLAQELQIAIVIIDYRDGTALSRLIEQRARVIIDLDWDRQDPNRRTVRARGAQLPSAGVSWRFEIGAVNGVERIKWLSSATEAPRRQRRGPAPRQDLEEWLTARLSGSGEARDVLMGEADALRFPRVSVDRAFKRLKGKSEPLGDGTARKRWRLP